MWVEWPNYDDIPTAKWIRVDMRTATWPTRNDSNPQLQNTNGYPNQNDRYPNQNDNKNYTEIIASINYSFSSLVETIQSNWPNLTYKINNLSREIQDAIQLASSSGNNEALKILTEQNVIIQEIGAYWTIPQILGQLMNIVNNSTEITHQRVSIVNHFFQPWTIRFERNWSNTQLWRVNTSNWWNNISGTHNGMIWERYTIVDRKTNNIIGIIAPPNGEIVFTSESFEAELRRVKEWKNWNWDIAQEDAAAIAAWDIPPSRRQELKRLQENNYLKTGAMSHESFKNLFWNNSLPAQKDIGNCFIIAAIWSLKNNPHFEYLMRMSMKEYQNGVTIKIPLWNPKWKEIFIDYNEVSQETIYNQNYWKPMSVGWKIIQPIQIDTRQTISPILWPIGYRMLVAAYTKAFNEELWNGLVLDYSKIEWWFPNNSIDLLLDWQYNKNPSEWSRNENQIIFTVDTEAFYQKLDNFRPWIDNLTLASHNLWQSWWHDINYKIDWSNQQLYQTHAYSIVWVDKVNKEVIIENPWNLWKSSERLILRYDQVQASFNVLTNNKLKLANIYKI